VAMRRLLNRLGNVLLGLVLLATLFLVVLPSVLSSRLAVVYSGSMEPAMPTGAIAVMMPVKSEQVKVGDIIAFDPQWDDSDAVISHRVIEIVEGDTLGFRTKGDANEDPDIDPVPADRVIARVNFDIPELGYILNWIGHYTSGRMGLTFFVGIPTILLIGIAFRDINFALNPSKRREKRRKEFLECRKNRRFHR